jgi:type IV secretion system protein VirB9
MKNEAIMKKNILSVLILTNTLVSTPFLYAESIPHSIAIDHRIKTVSYEPDNVTLIRAHYGYQTEILFDNNELVQNVSLGDSSAWQVVPVTNHLFIKPIASSNTNMTVLTNLRSYNFQLESSNSSKPQDQTYELKFIYPNTDTLQYTQNLITTSTTNDLTSPTQYNFKYSFTGDKSIAPIQVFDDNKFTYFKFRSNGNSTIPAIFSVDKNKNETLLNYHVDGDYIVVDRVENEYSLRDGKFVCSVYNDAAIGDWQSIS